MHPPSQTHCAFRSVWLLVLSGLFWLTAVSCRPAPPPPPDAAVASDRVKLMVNQDGFVRVAQADLAAAGLEIAAFDAANLQLSQGETAVPFIIDQDALIFYGQAPTDRYTSQRAYVLTSGIAGEKMVETAVSTPASVTAVDAITRTLRLEENLIYKSEARDFLENAPADADVWFWQPLRQGNSLPFEFDLPAVTDGSGQIRVQIKGETYNLEVENDHDFDLIVNGQLIGTIRFDGQIYYTGVVDVPAGVLQAGTNTLVLDNKPEGATFLDIMDLNWMAVDYAAPPGAINDELILSGKNGVLTLTDFSAAPALFDITNPETPQKLTGTSAAEPLTLAVQTGQTIAAIGPQGYQSAEILPMRASSLRGADNGADLLIVTTDALAPALEPLVAARQAEGLRVAVVPVAEIYDEFGGGAASPDSISAFVAYAAQNWQAPAPRYLFLVGDATSDYQNYLGLAPVNHVPSPMVPVSFSGETVSDARLADIDGDTYPDLAVGRWPVDSITAVESLVTRTLAYESGTAVDLALFAADGTDGSFASMAQRLSEGSRFTESQVSLLTSPSAADVVANWNAGTWLATYIGHGSLAQWGKENIFTLDAVKELQTAMPPIVVQLTCLTGLFTQPDQTSLTEIMLAHEGGPVLTVAATSLTLSASQEPFAAALLSNLQDTAVARIGDAFQNAKLALAASPSADLHEISDTFTLFGDPSAHIVRPNSSPPASSAAPPTP